MTNDHSDWITCSPKTIGLWWPWIRLQQIQAIPETTWRNKSEFSFQSFWQQNSVYLTKWENRLPTPTVDDKNTEDAARDLNQHTEQTVINDVLVFTYWIGTFLVFFVLLPEKKVDVRPPAWEGGRCKRKPIITHRHTEPLQRKLIKTGRTGKGTWKNMLSVLRSIFRGLNKSRTLVVAACSSTTMFWLMEAVFIRCSGMSLLLPLATRCASIFACPSFPGYHIAVWLLMVALFCRMIAK